MRTRSHRRDRGSIVIGWLTKIVVVLSLVAVCSFDALALAVGHVGAEDDADTVANAASEQWHRTHDIQGAYNAAAAAVTNPNESVLTQGFTVDSNGTVHLRLRRKITTLLMFRIPPLRKYTTVIVTGMANSLPT